MIGTRLTCDFEIWQETETEMKMIAAEEMTTDMKLRTQACRVDGAWRQVNRDE
jgi:hypothetical protein